jgi:HAD superfamily hydrolase (TIGR01509 family)
MKFLTFSVPFREVAGLYLGNGVRLLVESSPAVPTMVTEGAVSVRRVTSSDNRSPEAVVFDFAMTLRRLSAYYAQRLAEHGLGVLDAIPYLRSENQFGGVPFGVEDMAPVFEAGLVPEHGENAGRAAAAILSAYTESEAFEPIEGIDDLISDLHGAGRKIGILANGAAEVEAAHLPDFVDSGMVTATVLAGRDGVSKPGRAAFELIAERLEVAVEDCYFIDDSEQNVDAAREFGMSAFHFRGDVAVLRQALGDAGALSEHDDTA